jgi:Domain of unknown function (DUF4124)
MKAHKAVLALSVAAVVAGVLGPAVALADPGWQGRSRPHGGRHVVMGPGPGVGHVPSHRQFHRPFVPRVYPRFPYSSPYAFGTGYYAPPAFYGSSVGYDYGSSSGYDPPVAYGPPPAPAPITTLAVAPTRPSMIEYPTGRYELRGDGISTPYVWVWIPNPPPPPSAPEWPTTSRAEPPPPPGSSEAPSPRRSQLYRWVDDQGVVHLTDNPESVPLQYRKPAARTQGGAS